MNDRAPSILIVDDDPMAVRELGQTLAALGYDVLAGASSGDEAIARVSRRRPDLTLVDIGLEGTLDGIATAEILHQKYGIPVVYLTSEPDRAAIERARNGEPCAYLVRPVRSVELQSVVELALNQHQMEARLREHNQLYSPPAGPAASAADMPSRRDHATPTRRSTVLLADDHAMLRDGLTTLLTDHGFEVVGAVGDVDRLYEAARRLQPDIIVTDISMPPGLSGLDFLDRLNAERIASKVIVLTMHDDADLAARAARAGASGFLLKHSAGEELVTAIEQALQGRIYFSPAVTRGVMERLTAPAGPPEPVLTARQLDVLRLILEGLRMKEIAATLDLSARTVETHKYEMMRVLDVHSTAELITYAIEKRLIVR